MITLNQLRVFWAVAHSDSLTRAAKQLGVTQPALSQQLAKLENALGGQLFDRVNNQLVLSDAGRLPAAQGRDRAGGDRRGRGRA